MTAAGSDQQQYHHHHDNAVDTTKHSVQPVASPRSELVNTFIAYYSSADCAPVPAEAFSSHDLLSVVPLSSSSSTPTSSSSSSTAASVMNVRSGKKAPPGHQSTSGQSTDSEHTGNGSSESSSSLGDSAAAAARVLAAWQDRPLPATSTAIDTAVSSAGLSAASLADDPSIWTAARASTARIQSSNSTPRQVASSFDSHTREGSAPVTGSMEAVATNRRTDMGFLALLNSAAAFVAESSVSPQQHHQQHVADNPYLAHGDMLSDGTLTLSSINNGFGQAAVDVVAATEQGDYTAHYNAALSSAAYQDLAQALQHIAATSSSASDGSIISSTAMESRGGGGGGGHGPYDYASANTRISTRSSASAIRPDQIMPGDSLAAMGAEFPGVPPLPPGQSAAAASSASKRKRKDLGAAADAIQTPTKRKASHASGYPSGATTTPPIQPPHSAEARRAARKWSDEETDNLLQGCTKYGVGAWKKILDDPAFTFNSRTSVDLKDRFRTIRAQECAHSPHSKTAGGSGGGGGGSGGGKKNSSGKEPDVVWPLPPNSQRLQGLQRVQRKPTRNYTNDEDRRLLIGVLRHANHWTKIAADPDLKLGNRPGQSLRDRLRNAFPDVFELFGYVIPKKERADREPCGSGSGTHQQEPPERVSSTTGPSQRRKAPTGSKRLDGDIPENIKDKILAVLGDMNASLDPHPIPEPEDEGADSNYDGDGDGDPATTTRPMDVDSTMADAACADVGESRAGTARGTGKATTGRGPRRRSTVSGELAVSGDAPLPADLVAAASAAGREAARSNKRTTPNKRSRSRSKTMAAIDAHHNHNHNNHNHHLAASSDVGFKLDLVAGNTTAFPQPLMSNDGGIHSAPAHADAGVAGCGPMGDLGAFSDCDHRRTGGALSASAFGSAGGGGGGHRNFLLESFAPSVFTRPMGTMTPTDQLDALALEGRFGSGYSTPTHSARRRHSVQVDINDAMAAVVAAGMDRSGFSSSLHFFHPGVAGLDHHHHHHHHHHAATGAPGSSESLQMSAADTLRRMTAGEPIGADGYLFPRIAEDEATAAAAAAAAAVVADLSAQMSTSQTVAGTPASDRMHTPSGMSSNAAATAAAASMFKLPGAATAAEAAVLTAATIGGGGDAASAGYRGQQLRSAQRLLRANGVADDNSIGLSTMSGSGGGEGRVDLEALAQFSQWFPQFAPASLGWGMGDAGGQLGGGGGGGASESIDPNMLDAGLNSVMAAGGGGGGGAHARRRSQYDWYGLTPSLAAALEAAAATTNAAVAAQAAEEDGAMSSLGGGGGGGGGPFGLGHGALHPSYRRPSMPIFPTFGYPHGDMLGMAGGGGGGGGDVGADAGGSAEQQGLYGVAASQDGGSGGSGGGAGMVATAAADAVAVALGERSAGADAGGASRRARAAESPPSRRRTMHVPPSLLEGVATAEFASPSAAAADALAAQTLGFGPQQHARLASAPYQLRRPVGPATAAATAATAAMTRGRRSRTISSNSSSQQAMARLAAESAMPSAARPPLPPVSEVLPATTTAAAASMQFPLLSSASLGDMHRQHALAAAGGGGGRHARSLSGTQFTQMDAAAVGMPMDVDLDAMTTLSAAGDYSSSFKAASMWPFGGGSGDDDDVHLAAAEEEEEEEHCAGMHDETRSLIEMRGRDAPLPALVDLYRPASSTPTAGGQHHHHRHMGATTTHHSPALMASSSSAAAAAAASPVAPRSAASTPGRREAVGM